MSSINIKTAKLIRTLGADKFRIMTWLAEDQPGREPSTDPEDKEEAYDVWNVSLIERIGKKREILRITGQFFSEKTASEGMEELLTRIICGADPDEILRDKEYASAAQKAREEAEALDNATSVVAIDPEHAPDEDEEGSKEKEAPRG